jgi:hypothetical protein
VPARYLCWYAQETIKPHAGTPLLSENSSFWSGWWVLIIIS